jgi:hypothetical protein
MPMATKVHGDRPSFFDRSLEVGGSRNPGA